MASRKWKRDPDVHLPLRDHVRSKELAKAMRPTDLELPPPERDPRAPVTFSLAEFAFDPVYHDEVKEDAYGIVDAVGEWHYATSDDTFEADLKAADFQEVDWINLAHFNNKPKWLRQLYQNKNKQVTLKEEEEEEEEK